MSDTVRCENCGNIIELCNSHLIKDAIRALIIVLNITSICRELQTPNKDNDRTSPNNQLIIEGITQY